MTAFLYKIISTDFNKDKINFYVEFLLQVSQVTLKKNPVLHIESHI